MYTRKKKKSEYEEKKREKTAFIERGTLYLCKPPLGKLPYMPYLYKYDKNLIAAEMYEAGNTYDSQAAFG